MGLEELTQYEAYCDGPSDLPVGQGCPDKARYVDKVGWGDSRYYSAKVLAAEMIRDGWYVEMSLQPGYPVRHGEVMCPKCREAAGE